MAPLPGQARAQKITEADKIGSEVRGIMLHTNQERERERERGKDGLMGIEERWDGRCINRIMHPTDGEFQEVGYMYSKPMEIEATTFGRAHSWHFPLPNHYVPQVSDSFLRPC